MPLPQKPVNSPFNARSTAQEVTEAIDLTGKTAIVTGGSAGLGVETARALAKAGADIVLPVRSKDKGEAAAADIRETTGAEVETAAMDLGDYASVRSFAKAFVASGRKLDLLINNAGIMATPLRRVGNGFESQFGTNHLGHMLLTCTLAPALLKAGRARVVELSSIGHRRSPVNFDDPNFQKRPYEKWEAYGQSKTANSLFAVELNRRLEPKGVFAYAVHPGGIMTELQRDMSQDEIRAFGWVDDKGKVNERFKSVAQGAATSCWAATSALLDAGGGVYCEDCNVAVALPADAKDMSGVRPWAIDPEAARKLWALSETLLGERFEL
jgi:NAD(P)-dependent dehydrogenase (short-subunit alcohol dehydrogenase family)